jgi:hypothetical protein
MTMDTADLEKSIACVNPQRVYGKENPIGHHWTVSELEIVPNCSRVELYFIGVRTVDWSRRSRTNV